MKNLVSFLLSLVFLMGPARAQWGGVLSGSSGGDPYAADVSLLLHMNVIGGFADSSLNGFTLTGDATISTVDPKFGTGSGFFDFDQYLILPNSAAFVMGAGDWTIEAWVKLTVANTFYYAIVDLRGTPGDPGPLLYIESTDHALKFNNGLADVISGAVLNDNQWYFIAVCKASGSTRLFVDGVQSGSTYADSNTYTANTAPTIGTFNTNPTLVWRGNMDEFRITKGAARYTSNFTPPVAAFPNP